MFKKITKDAKLPTKATRFSAGVDVYANEDVTIDAGETAIVGLGIAIDEDIVKRTILLQVSKWKYANTKHAVNNFLLSHYIALKPRSSLRAKGLISHSAVIDLDYKDEIKMIIHNPIIEENFDDSVYKGESAFSESNFKINKGGRIGQILLMEHKSYLFGIESEEERTGGFGSSGN